MNFVRQIASNYSARKHLTNLQLLRANENFLKIHRLKYSRLSEYQSSTVSVKVLPFRRKFAFPGVKRLINKQREEYKFFNVGNLHSKEGNVIGNNFQREPWMNHGGWKIVSQRRGEREFNEATFLLLFVC